MADIKNIKVAYADLTLVRMLEDLLGRARNGDITSAAIAFVWKDASTGNAYYCPDRPITMLGEISVLTREIQDEWVDLRLHKAGRRYD